MKFLPRRPALAQVEIVSADWTVAKSSDKEWSFWYFGSDYRQFVSFSESAKTAGMDVASAGELINSVAESVRGDLIELDAQVASGRARQSWECSDLAERNPLTSDLCLNICRGIALVKSARMGGSHVVFVEDGAMASAIRRLCSGAGLSVRSHVPLRLSRGIKRAVKAHAAFLRNYWRRRRDLASLSVTLKDMGHREVWLMSWLDGSAPGRSSSNGRSDRFLSGLDCWLGDGGLSTAWLMNAAWWVAPSDQIVRSAHEVTEGPCMIVDAAFGYGSLARGYAAYFLFPFAVRRRLTIAGVDLSSLLVRSVWNEMASARIVFAALFLTLGRSLRRAGEPPRALIYTYENQPWERAMLAGLRSNTPTTKTVGVQHAPFSDRYFSCHPSARQWSSGSVPDQLFSIGTEFRERLVARGAPADRVKVGGALRFSSLLTGTKLQKSERGERVVLVVCPIDFGEALDLVHTAAMASLRVCELPMVVNFHPMVGQDFRATLVSEINELVPEAVIEFTNETAAAWLPRASVVLYNSSAVSFEAAAYGIPSIFVGSKIGLDIDKMCGRSGFRARTAEELSAQIKRALFATPADMAEAESFLTSCLTIPKREFWTDEIKTLSGY